MRTPFRWTLLVSMLMFVSLFALTGCDDDDNPASSEDEDHLEAFGVQVLLDGTVLATVEPGDAGADVTGSLAVTVGVPVLYDVLFLDADGDWIDPEAEHEHEGEEEGEEEAHGLEVQQNASALLTIAGHEDDATVDHWQFQLEGLTAGSTEIRIVVLHNGHEDYVSAWIPVTVADPAS